MLADPDFIPFEPPARSNPKALLRSMVETFPAALYEKPMAARAARTMSWISSLPVLSLKSQRLTLMYFGLL